MNISKNREFLPINANIWSCNCPNVVISLFLHENCYYCMFWEAHIRPKWWNLNNRITKLGDEFGDEYFKNPEFSWINANRWCCQLQKWCDKFVLIRKLSLLHVFGDMSCSMFLFITTFVRLQDPFLVKIHIFIIFIP